MRWRETPRITQDAPLGNGLDVGGDDGRPVQSVSDVEEGVLAVGSLEDEEHPGQDPLVVSLCPTPFFVLLLLRSILRALQIGVDDVSEDRARYITLCSYRSSPPHDWTAPAVDGG